MEGPDAGLNWEWQDELLASLDAHSPLDTTNTLWEDISQSERMLERTPASKEDEECIWDVKAKAKHGYSSELIYEDSVHTKRRRMLNFEDEEDDGVFMSSLEPSQLGSFENIPTTYDAQNGVFRMQTTSSTTKWLNNLDDGMFNIILSLYAQTLQTSLGSAYSRDIAIDGRCKMGHWLSASIIEEEFESEQFQKRTSQQEFPMIFESVTISSSKADEAKSTKTDINMISPLKRSLSTDCNMSFGKMATPVAYPFSVLKPSGMQGDVTLNDINKRIMMVHDHPRNHGMNDSPFETCQNGEDGRCTSNILAKSVVALTKIHTEGNGTITIMRTKN